MAEAHYRHARHRGLSGTINRALEWWFGELGASLRLLRPARPDRGIEFEISPDDEPVLRRGVKARKARGSKNVLLQLDEKVLLYRKVKLPAAVRRNVDQVIGYEFNKYFPMNAEDALFSSRIVTAGSGATSIEIEIWAVNRRLIDTYLSMIRQNFNLEARKLIVTGSDGRGLIIRDLERERRIASGAYNSGLLLAMNLTLVLLTVALVVYPVKRMDAYLEAQQAEIENLERKARPIVETRENIMALNQRFDEMVEVKKQFPGQAEIWSFVTRSIGEAAILDRLQITGNKVQLTGKAKSVEDLIRNLEKIERIDEVKIAGQVTATRDNLFEVLNLILTLKE